MGQRAWAACPTPQFGAARAFPAGETPIQLCILDLNKDGKPDIVSASNNGHAVSVLLGNGDGSFKAKVDYDTGDNPYAVAVSDVNGDSKPDIVTAIRDSNTVSVLLGKGNGAFKAKADFATGDSPLSVAIADVNSDGKPDIITANQDGGTVSVLAGNGDGTFKAKVDYAVSDLPESIACADLNGDGKPDIATGNGGFHGISSNVSVLMGRGDGTFSSPVNYPSGSAPVHVEIADANDDGKLDIVTANANGNSVSLLFGNGDGTFKPNLDLGTGVTPVSVTVADVNFDGIPDVITANANPFGAGSVSVLLGLGGGRFQAHAEFGTGSNPHSVAIADVNGDSKPDIVTANNGDGTVSVLLNTCTDKVVPLSIASAAYALRSAAGLRSLTASDLTRYDLTSDHAVTIADAVRIARNLAGR
jgi:hypothetical protein